MIPHLESDFLENLMAGFSEAGEGACSDKDVCSYHYPTPPVRYDAHIGLPCDSNMMCKTAGGVASVSQACIWGPRGESARKHVSDVSGPRFFSNHTAVKHACMPLLQRRWLPAWLWQCIPPCPHLDPICVQDSRCINHADRCTQTAEASGR